MFGKRSAIAPGTGQEPAPAGGAAPPPRPNLAASQAIRSLEVPQLPPPPKPETRRSDEYYQTKSVVFGPQ